MPVSWQRPATSTRNRTKRWARKRFSVRNPGFRPIPGPSTMRSLPGTTWLMPKAAWSTMWMVRPSTPSSARMPTTPRTPAAGLLTHGQNSATSTGSSRTLKILRWKRRSRTIIWVLPVSGGPTSTMTWSNASAMFRGLSVHSTWTIPMPSWLPGTPASWSWRMSGKTSSSPSSTSPSPRTKLVLGSPNGSPMRSLPASLSSRVPSASITT